MTIVHYPPRSAQVWKSSVDSAAELPTTGNQLHDCRLVADEEKIYFWDGSAWQATAGSGGGSGPSNSYFPSGW